MYSVALDIARNYAKERRCATVFYFISVDLISDASILIF